MTTPRENTGNLWRDYDTTSHQATEPSAIWRMSCNDWPDTAICALLGIRQTQLWAAIQTQTRALKDIDPKYWADPRLDR